MPRIPRVQAPTISARIPEVSNEGAVISARTVNRGNQAIAQGMQSLAGSISNIASMRENAERQDYFLNFSHAWAKKSEELSKSFMEKLRPVDGEFDFTNPENKNMTEQVELDLDEFYNDWLEKAPNENTRRQIRSRYDFKNLAFVEDQRAFERVERAKHQRRSLNKFADSNFALEINNPKAARLNETFGMIDEMSTEMMGIHFDPADDTVKDYINSLYKKGYKTYINGVLSSGNAALLDEAIAATQGSLFDGNLTRGLSEIEKQQALQNLLDKKESRLNVTASSLGEKVRSFTTRAYNGYNTLADGDKVLIIQDIQNHPKLSIDKKKEMISEVVLSQNAGQVFDSFKTLHPKEFDQRINDFFQQGLTLDKDAYDEVLKYKNMLKADALRIQRTRENNRGADTAIAAEPSLKNRITDGIQKNDPQLLEDAYIEMKEIQANLGIENKRIVEYQDALQTISALDAANDSKAKTMVLDKFLKKYPTPELKKEALANLAAHNKDSFPKSMVMLGDIQDNDTREKMYNLVFSKKEIDGQYRELSRSTTPSKIEKSAEEVYADILESSVKSGDPDQQQFVRSLISLTKLKAKELIVNSGEYDLSGREDEIIEEAKKQIFDDNYSVLSDDNYSLIIPKKYPSERVELFAEKVMDEDYLMNLDINIPQKDFNRIAEQEGPLLKLEAPGEKKKLPEQSVKRRYVREILRDGMLISTPDFEKLKIIRKNQQGNFTYVEVNGRNATGEIIGKPYEVSMFDAISDRDIMNDFIDTELNRQIEFVGKQIKQQTPVPKEPISKKKEFSPVEMLLKGQIE